MTNEEAIKMLKSKLDGHTDTSWEWTETVRMAIKALEQKPSAERTAELTHIVRGKWIYEHISDFEELYKCSRCQYEASDWFPPTFNFCPNCGAKMKKEKNI